MTPGSPGSKYPRITLAGNDEIIPHPKDFIAMLNNPDLETEDIPFVSVQDLKGVVSLSQVTWLNTFREEGGREAVQRRLEGLEMKESKKGFMGIGNAKLSKKEIAMKEVLLQILMFMQLR